MKTHKHIFISLLFVCLLGTTLPASAAITFVAAKSLPADNGTLTDSAPRPITPPAGMKAGDFVYLIAFVRSPTATLTLSDIASQGWTAKAQQTVNGQGRVRVFTTRFNGTWGANPTVQTDEKTGAPLTLALLAFRPSSAANTWTVDAAQQTSYFSAPGTPANVTATAQPAFAASTVTVAAFATGDDNSWAPQTSGWLSPGGATQFRNTSGNDTSLSIAYKIRTSSGAIGSAVNRQTANGPDAGRWLVETFAEVPAAAAKKWHPGHAISLGSQATAANKGYQDAWIAETANMPNIKSILMQFMWGAIEPTRGNYDPTLIDNFIATCAAYGKKAIIRIKDREFGPGTVQNYIDQGRLPAYVQTLIPTGGYFKSPNKDLVAPKLWYAPVMDRVIAMDAYLANRYDNDPRVEGIETDESALDAAGVEGFAAAPYMDQLKRLADAMDEHWPRTNIFFALNSCCSTVENRLDLFAHVFSKKMILTGPDVPPVADTWTQFQRIQLGIDGGVSHVGEHACGFEIQGPNLGGKETPSGMDPNTIMDTIYNKIKPTGPLKCSYAIWLRKTYNFAPDTNDIQWNNPAYPKIKDWLSKPAASIPLTTACPANYEGNCDTN